MVRGRPAWAFCAGWTPSEPEQEPEQESLAVVYQPLRAAPLRTFSSQSLASEPDGQLKTRLVFAPASLQRTRTASSSSSARRPWSASQVRWRQRAASQSLDQDTGSFQVFAVSELLVPFLRSVLAAVEGDHGLLSYHLRVSAWQGGPDGKLAFNRDRRLDKILQRVEARAVKEAASLHGFLVYVVGSGPQGRLAPSNSNIQDLDAPIKYEDAEGTHVRVDGVSKRDLLVPSKRKSGPSLARCSIDYQGRACYVVTVAPDAPSELAAQREGEPVRRLSDLGDAELAELWRTAADAVSARHSGFRDMRVNAGSFQNLAHLHVKVFVDPNEFCACWEAEPWFNTLRASQRRFSVVSESDSSAPSTGPAAAGHEPEPP